MKKNNKNILLIGAAVILYFLLIKKAKKDKNGGSGGGSGAGSGGGLFSNVTPKQRAKIKTDVNKAVQSINITPEPDEFDEFKKQYQQSIKQCKI